MTGIRIATVNYASITEALRAAKAGDVILLDPGTFSAPLLLTPAQAPTLKGSGSSNQTILLNTPILERSGQGKFAPGFTIQDLAFEYRGQTQNGYLFAPSIGSLPYNPINPTITSFRLKNVAFTGIHQGGFSGTYMDISGAKNTIFNNIRVSLSGQASFDPSMGTGGGFFIFHEGGADIQILNSEFNEAGFSGAFIILYVSDALVASNRFIGGGLIRQDDGSNPADNPRGERFVNAGGTFSNNHLSNGAFFDYLLQFNSDTGTVWTDYKKKFATADGTFGLRTSVTANTFDIISSGYGVLIRADIAPQKVEKMLSISGNIFNNGLAIRSDLEDAYDLAFGQNYVNGILFDHLRVGGTGHDQLNTNRANGRNWISGGFGNDQLHSSPGKLDAFVFYTSPNPQSNTDTILGFENGGPESDQIWLDGEVFRGLLNNGDLLDTRSFTSNSSGAAIGNAGQIIHNTSTGELWYDSDGAGNLNPARFAILSGKESVALKDFRLFNRSFSSPALPVISLAVSPASVLENGPTNLLYTFARTGSTASPLSVNYAISGSADSNDYTGATPGTGKTITFPTGSATATVSVKPKADSGVEPNETIALSLAAGTGYTIGTTSPVVGTIINDDLPPPPPVIQPPVISLAISPASVSEDGPARLTFTFLRSGSTSSALTVNYTVAGTATLATDYTGINAAGTTKTITFAPGSAAASVTVDPTTDSTVEFDETVTLSLTSGSGYTIGPASSVVGSITNDDVSLPSPLPKPTVIGAIDLDGVSSSPATQAAANAFDNRPSSKYLNLGGRNSGLSLTYGLPTKLSSFVITTANDLPSRDPASYQLYGFNRGSWTLLSSGNLQLPTARLSDSAPVALPSLPSLTQYRLVFPKLKTSANGMQIADLKLYGTQSPALPKPTGIRAIDLDSASSSPATHAAANAFDNRPSSKYLNLGGRNSGLSFTYGLPTKLSSFVITTANDLPSRDPASYQLYGFNRGSWTLLSSGNLQLPNARLSDSAPVALPSLPSLTQYRLVFPKLKTSANGMQIADLKLYGTQSPPPGPPTPPVITLTVSPASVSEDGPANLAFTFLRSGSTSSALTVNYIVAGTATLGPDYTGIGGTQATVTFAAGSATATVIVDPTADSTVEGDETVLLTLVSGTGYSIGTPAAAVGTITNDDVVLPVLPPITLVVSPAAVAEDGTANLVYTFTRTGSTASVLTVNYSVGGTATLGTDYTGISGSAATVIFAAGSATATVIVDPTADSTVEGDETVSLTLLAGTGYDIGTSGAVVGTIANDDVALPVITLSVTPASVLEDGVGNLAYTFSRTGSTSAELTVNYSVGGSATLGTDYTGINAAGSTKTITFAAGSAAATVTVDPTTDSTVEPDETVALSIASGSGYTIGTTSPVVGTITNDDLQQSPPPPPPPAPPPGQWTYNWANASPLGNIPSILKASVALPSPRSGEPPLALTALRVDLRDPAISLTSTGRRSDWANNTIETTSETSRRYMSRSRNSGLPMVAAINTAPFELDLAKQFLSVPTNIRGFAVSEGQLVSSTDYNGDTFKSTFLYDPVTGARIENKASSASSLAATKDVSYPAPAAEVALASTLKVATSGFGIVLNNGVVSGGQVLQNARSALGLTADGRYLTMLTVDRTANPAQPSGWQGATDYDVGTILKGFGSSMGMNLDGGGSTQLVWWNPGTNQPELLSNPAAERYVGTSMGVLYQPI